MTQSSSTAQMSWLQTMTIGHETIGHDKEIYTWRYILVYYILYEFSPGRDGPKAGMVPFTGQPYKFLMGRFFHHLL